MAVLLAVDTASAAVPRIINIQGRLALGDGTAVTSSKTLTISLWSDPASQDAPTHKCFEETQTINVRSGLFSVALGGITSGGIGAGCTFTVPYWVQIAVVGDTPMTPRLALAASPYALRANGADVASLALDVNCTNCVEGNAFASPFQLPGPGPYMLADVTACPPGDTIVVSRSISVTCNQDGWDGYNVVDCPSCTTQWHDWAAGPVNLETCSYSRASGSQCIPATCTARPLIYCNP